MSDTQNVDHAQVGSDTRAQAAPRPQFGQQMTYREYETWKESLGSGNDALAEVTGVAIPVRDSTGKIDPDGFSDFVERDTPLGPKHLDLQGMQRLILKSLKDQSGDMSDKAKDIPFDIVASVRYLKGPLANRDSGWQEPRQIDAALAARPVGLG